MFSGASAAIRLTRVTRAMRGIMRFFLNGYLDTKFPSSRILQKHGPALGQIALARFSPSTRTRYGNAGLLPLPAEGWLSCRLRVFVWNRDNILRKNMRPTFKLLFALFAFSPTLPRSFDREQSKFSFLLLSLSLPPPVQVSERDPRRSGSFDLTTRRKNATIRGNLASLGRKESPRYRNCNTPLSRGNIRRGLRDRQTLWRFHGNGAARATAAALRRGVIKRLSIDSAAELSTDRREAAWRDKIGSRQAREIDIARLNFLQKEQTTRFFPRLPRQSAGERLGRSRTLNPCETHCIPVARM